MTTKTQLKERLDDPAKQLRLPIGQVLATPGAIAFLEEQQKSAYEIIGRHMRGDWGDVCEDDATLNDQAYESGGRILSCYKFTDGSLWVITEADRSCTTILLPDEY